MLTKKDIDLLLEHFVTRTEFDQAIERLEEKLVTKEEFNKKFDLVMTTLDEVLGEVKAMRQEQAANSQRQDDSDKEIANLKQRVDKLQTHHLSGQPI